VSTATLSFSELELARLRDAVSHRRAAWETAARYFPDETARSAANVEREISELAALAAKLDRHRAHETLT
jgi:hypothetical protein